MVKKIIFLYFFLLCVQGFSQKQFVHEYEWRLLEDSLASLAKTAINKKMGEGFSLLEDSMAVRVVIQLLRSDKEIRFDFKEENVFIKSLSDENHSFRIVTWFFLQAPGYLVYRGVVQFKNSSKLIPLFDQVRFMTQLDNGQQTDDMDSPDKWYGAFYYDMIPYSNFDKKITDKFLLLGKRQDHVLYDAKVLDVLVINYSKQTVLFGDFFEVPRNLFNIPSSNRFVMLHKKKVGTILTYSESHHAIVFDILDTEKPEERVKFNNKMYLIPTGLYQSFVYEKNFGWRLKEQAFEQMTIDEFLKKKNPNNPKISPLIKKNPAERSY